MLAIRERFIPTESFLFTLYMFSQLKLVKTRTRNQMNERTLTSLLRITIEGPDLDKFPVADAVELWASVKNRHIFL